MAEAARQMAEIGDAAPGGDRHADVDDRDGPVRRCLVTGFSRPKSELLRFVIGPDGWVVPDLDGVLPGRGLWVGASGETLRQAIRKNLFAKAARPAVTVDADLAERVEQLLVRRSIELIGLARRAKAAVAGYAKVDEFLRRQPAGVLLLATDGSESEASRLAGPAVAGRRIQALAAAELGQAFGADHRVHAAIAPGPLAQRLTEVASRLAALRGLDQHPMNSDALTSGETTRR